MKIKVCLIVILIILLILLFLYIRFPIYKMNYNEDGLESIKINNVTYVRKVDTRWRLRQPYKQVGFVDDLRVGVYKPRNVECNDFVHVRCIDDHMGILGLFHRDDLDIQEPSADSVTEIEFHKYGEQNSKDSIIVNDSKLIEKIFHVLENEESRLYYDYRKLGSIFFYNNEMKGLVYRISFLETYDNQCYFKSSTQDFLVPDNLAKLIKNYFN